MRGPVPSALVAAACGLLAHACGNEDNGEHASSGGSGGSGGSGAAAGAATGGLAGIDASSGGAPSGGSGGTDASIGGSSTGGTGTAGSGGTSAACMLHASGKLDLEWTVPGHAERKVDLHFPPGYDCTKPVPLVLTLHGGGSERAEMLLLTCPGDDPDAAPPDANGAGCLNTVADTKGFVIAYPDGTLNPDSGKGNRTYNAGGGKNGFNCVSGHACTLGIDELAYFTALLDALPSAVNVDPKRIFATGISNGGAMSHRLACELSSRIAAIAPVAGGNQAAAFPGCKPARPVPVLEIHGTADSCWPYLGGTAVTCLAFQDMVAIPDDPAIKAPPSSVAFWAQNNGCTGAPSSSSLPDTDPNDGTTTTVTHYTGCQAGADVELYAIKGGGHFWPGGFTHRDFLVGKKPKDWNASEVMLDFFAQHPLP